ncbi:hypothetical protein PQQ96_15800 [Paraburkholderia sediminicola]|uniref:hypothetical protein n=1 Tax=Paraburkholderia sediminicola TaxID=458836 RepID=UPI0038B75BEC
MIDPFPTETLLVMNQCGLLFSFMNTMSLVSVAVRVANVSINTGSSRTSSSICFYLFRLVTHQFNEHVSHRSVNRFFNPFVKHLH